MISNVRTIFSFWLSPPLVKKNDLKFCKRERTSPHEVWVRAKRTKLENMKRIEQVQVYIEKPAIRKKRKTSPFLGFCSVCFSSINMRNIMFPNSATTWCGQLLVVICRKYGEGRSNKNTTRRPIFLSILLAIKQDVKIYKE